MIDSYYNRYEDYEDEFPSQRRTEKLYKDTLETVQSILPEIKNNRWGNKTDFYSLFVATAKLLKTGKVQRSKISQVRNRLLHFAGKVDERLSDEGFDVKDEVIDYVRAVEKGANEKTRRAVRHAILVALMGPFFKAKKSSK